MEYEDRIVVHTPEGVELSLLLAGLGSRFMAALVDVTLQGLLVVAAALVLSVGDLGPDASRGFAAALYSVFFMLVVFGYDISFEVLASGRTPGKRWTGTRVVRVGGQPVNFVTSSIRNLMRLVDILPGMYLVGCISILLSGRNQRLGDLAAGTLVVRERLGGRRTEQPPARPRRPGPRTSWDVSAVTAEELGAVRRFLDRRYELEPNARADLARTLAERLRPKVVGGAGVTADEGFLELLAADKASRT